MSDMGFDRKLFRKFSRTPPLVTQLKAITDYNFPSIKSIFHGNLLGGSTLLCVDVDTVIDAENIQISSLD
jgi:hypothetical protein